MAYSHKMDGLIGKLTSQDKDIRYMAVSDLLQELQGGRFTELDKIPRLEDKFCLEMLARTQDQASDVCSLAMKCLASLVKVVSVENGRKVVGELCTSITQGSDTKQEQGSVSLKTIVANLEAGTTAKMLVEESVPKLVEFIQSTDNAEATSGCLDILNDMGKKYGPDMAGKGEPLVDCLTKLLLSRDTLVRKKTANCLASVGPHFQPHLKSKVCLAMVDMLANTTPQYMKTSINALAAVVQGMGKDCHCRTLVQSIPKLVKVVEGCDDEDDDEVREACLHAFELFVRYHPETVEPNVHKMLSICLNLLSYDPNFAYGEEEDETDEYMADGDEDGYDDDDDEFGDYSDNDDTSWKVRKASAKCLASIIQACPQLLLEVTEASYEKLVGRLKEREQNVLVDILSALQTLVWAICSSTHLGVDARGRCTTLIDKSLPKIVKMATKELESRNTLSKVKLGYCRLLKELVGGARTSIVPHAHDVLRRVQHVITEKDMETNVKVEAFSLLKSLLTLSSEDAYSPKSLKELLCVLLSAATGKYYKISAEALRVVVAILGIMHRRWDDAYVSAVRDIYNMAFQQIVASDVDHEFREEVIVCVGLLLSQFATKLEPGKVEEALRALFDKMMGETTRVPAIKTITTVAASGNVDISCISQDLVQELTTYLKKANNALKFAALSALSTLIGLKQAGIASQTEYLVEKSSELVKGDDISLASATLQMLAKLLAMESACVSIVEKAVMPKVLVLLQSPLLQGSSIVSLQTFFKEITKLLPSSAINQTIESIEHAALSDGVKHNIQSTVAKCIASVCLATSQSKCDEYAQQLLLHLGDASVPIQKQVLCLMCLAEIGRKSDLGRCEGIDTALLRCLESVPEDVRSAASYALGSIATQNLGSFLPKLFAHLESYPKLQYLLLLSLKEMIVSLLADVELSKHLQDEKTVTELVDVLFKYCESEEDVIRSIIAECLGHLVVSNPGTVLPLLRTGLKSDSPNAREVSVTAFRDVVSDAKMDASIQLAVSPAVMEFVSMMDDPDLKVQRAAILLFNALLHHRQDMVVRHMGTLLPLLYKKTHFSKDSLREIILGPFKQIVDDSLQVRRAAFECIHTIHTNLSNVDAGDPLLDVLLSGVSDHYDFTKVSHLSLADHFSMKMTCHSILSKLSESAGDVFVARSEDILTPLYKILTHKLKADAVKQEIERVEEVQNSALRTIKAFKQVEGMEESEGFKKFLTGLKKFPSMLQKYEEAT